MAGIYIHIPFCKQACHYCNFYFTTSLKRKNELGEALLKEIELQRNYLENETIETIYFGGGTPSLLEIHDCRLLIDQIAKNFSIIPEAEVTLEANPDDITVQKLVGWQKSGINRLSIGVQSFFQEDLEWMNRAHNARQAYDAIELSLKYGFKNITIDLIYGYPSLTNEKWKSNVKKAIAYHIPHLSCYALTVEPKTALQKLIALNKTGKIDPDKQASQLLLLIDWMKDEGYEHYEISNFAKLGYRSRHNSSYWRGRKYLGIGPSAHSFNGQSRQWNVSNIMTYIESIKNRILPVEKESLTDKQKINEYIMTSLRTIEGLDMNIVQRKWGKEATDSIEKTAKKFISIGKMKAEKGLLKLTEEGILLADGISAELFFI